MVCVKKPLEAYKESPEARCKSISLISCNCNSLREDLYSKRLSRKIFTRSYV